MTLEDSAKKREIRRDYLDRFYQEADALLETSASYTLYVSRLDAAHQGEERVVLSEEEERTLAELDGAVRSLAFIVLTRLKALSEILKVDRAGVRDFEKHYQRVKDAGKYVDPQLLEDLNTSLQKIIVSLIAFDETTRKYGEATNKLAE